jgi:UvrD/REP helicase N-terminal domain
MKYFYNKNENGLELLNVTNMQNASAEDWLNLEIELRKLTLSLLKKDKVSLTISKKRIQKMQKSFIWPENLANLLKDLINFILDKNSSNNIIFKSARNIFSKYFETLPKPGYWDFEELIYRLDNILQYVKEKDFKFRFQKILNLVDNHQWTSEFRYQLEDILHLDHSNEIYQKISNIIKNLKQHIPLPIF